MLPYPIIHIIFDYYVQMFDQLWTTCINTEAQKTCYCFKFYNNRLFVEKFVQHVGYLEDGDLWLEYIKTGLWKIIWVRRVTKKPLNYKSVITLKLEQEGKVAGYQVCSWKAIQNMVVKSLDRIYSYC